MILECTAISYESITRFLKYPELFKLTFIANIVVTGWGRTTLAIIQ